MTDPALSDLVRQAVPADPSTHLRPAIASDDLFCRALLGEQSQAGFAPLGLGGDLLEHLLDGQYRAQMASAARQYPQAETLIVTHHGASVGRVVVALDSKPAGDVALHLIDIAISATARGRGIGGSVITALVSAAASKGLVRCTLWVLDSNAAAQRLYDRLGFVSTERRGAHRHMVKPLVTARLQPDETPDGA